MSPLTLALIFVGWIFLNVVGAVFASRFFSAIKRNQR
jgi:hypothetical protein